MLYISLWGAGCLVFILLGNFSYTPAITVPPTTPSVKKRDRAKIKVNRQPGGAVKFGSKKSRYS